MKIKEIRSAVDLVRDASKADLVIVSLFLLPILLGSWCLLLNGLSLLDEHDAWKFWIVFFVFLVYVAGLFLMKYWDPREEKLRRAQHHVENRLKQRAKNRASFDAIRSEVNEAYDDKFLYELIDKNGELFRRCTMKLGAGKPGIMLVAEDTDDSPLTPAADG